VRIGASTYFAPYEVQPRTRVVILSNEQADVGGLPLRDTDQLVQLNTDYGPIRAHVVEVPVLHVGPWKVEKVRAYVYPKARLVLGQSALASFTLDAREEQAGRCCWFRNDSRLRVTR